MLGALDRRELTIEEGDVGVVGGEQIGAALGTGPHHQHRILGLDSRGESGNEVAGVEIPVDRVTLGRAQLGILLSPGLEGADPEPSLDQLVDGSLGQHLGQEELLVVVAQLDHGRIGEPQQLVAGEAVLVVLDPVHDVQVVLLPQGTE